MNALSEWAEAFGVALVFMGGVAVLLLIKLRWFWLALALAILIVPAIT